MTLLPLHLVVNWPVFTILYETYHRLRKYFSNSVPKDFTASSIDVVVFKWRKKIVRREIGKTVRYSHDKKNGSLSNCRYCADRTQCLPGPGGVLAERVKAVHSTHRAFSILAFRLINICFCDAVLDWRITFTSSACTSTILDSGEAT